ncbi:MAG: hypothetical protein RLN85_05950 [Pseudomonadales bacterium]
MFQTPAVPITRGDQWFVVKPILEKAALEQHILLLIMSVLAIATIWYAVRVFRRDGTLLPVYILIGSALACFYEPLGDLLAHVTYAEASQVNYISSYGFLVPLWVLPTYILFFGYPTLFLMERIERGVTLQWWMAVFVISVIGSWIFEIPLIALEFQSYYGDNAPFKLLGYPIWMGFVNAATISIVATAAFFLKHSWVGTKCPSCYIVLIPLLVAGANAGSGLPASFALNSSNDPGIVNIAASTAMMLSVTYAWICANLIRSHGSGLTECKTAPP